MHTRRCCSAIAMERPSGINSECAATDRACCVAPLTCVRHSDPLLLQTRSQVEQAPMQFPVRERTRRGEVERRLAAAQLETFQGCDNLVQRISACRSFALARTGCASALCFEFSSHSTSRSQRHSLRQTGSGAARRDSSKHASKVRSVYDRLRSGAHCSLSPRLCLCVRLQELMERSRFLSETLKYSGYYVIPSPSSTRLLQQHSLVASSGGAAGDGSGGSSQQIYTPVFERYSDRYRKILGKKTFYHEIVRYHGGACD